MKPMTLKIAAALALSTLSATAAAQLTVDTAWTRATVPGQPATGAFMTLTSTDDAKLVGARSEAAAATEIHEMAMVDDIMKMREVPSIALPAGQAVALKPGGYHLMLLDLKAPIKAGDHVPVSLIIEKADGSRETVAVQAVARALGADAKQHGHEKKGGHGSH